MSAVTPVLAESIAQALLAEFEVQAPITRRFLERLPEDKLTWKPHEKSMTAGQLAYHIASTTGGVARLVHDNPRHEPGPPSFPQPSSLKEILDKHDESVVTVRAELGSYGDAAMLETWRLRIGEREVAAMPRVVFLRNIMLNHWYQHRGQFSVYLRLLNIPVPASWGPSADEMPQFVQKNQEH
jgi:uncharacterized damage-inducible protein DinB